MAETLKNDEAEKYASRKYRLARLVIKIATLLVTVPPLVTVWLLPAPLILLTGTEWLSIVSATLLFYQGANVADKYLDNKAAKSDETEAPQD